MNMKSLTIAVALLLSSSAIGHTTTIDELQSQIDSMSSEIKTLKSAGAGKSEGYSGKSLLERTHFGGYGELDYVFTRENGNGNGGNTFDPHRIVLYMDSQLAPWINFTSELEWEHGGVKDEPNSDGTLSGEASVEQAYLDFKLSRAFNIKAGAMLVPLGAINLYHEPTNLNSSERPALDQILIPSTWSEMGAGIHGSLGDRVDYQLLLMNGLDGSKFSAKDGIRDGRQNFNADNNHGKAVAGRLELRPLSNLNTNLSVYSGNSAAQGSAYTTIGAVDAKYSLGSIDLAGEYVYVYQDKPASLGATDIGRNMSGYWVEGAWHVMPKEMKSGRLADADALLFARWSQLDTQQGNIADPAKSSGQFFRNYTNFGVVFKPTTTVSIKADYQLYDDHSSAGETPLDNDKFQLSVGFVF
jgi:hypothetical protein